MAKKYKYSITLNVEVEEEHGSDGRRILWTSFKAWKHGIVNDQNCFIDTEACVKMTDENMKYIGKEIFKAAREMYDEDQ